ncbi:MAG TPA: pitrilysin family protein [Nitrososphaerales archaeon]|nr:pitrilysin family protein [Nitrososphaerales archaeon]
MSEEAKETLGKFELQRELFENGLALLSNRVRENETVAISGSIKAGTLCDPAGASGTAELISRLLMRGTTLLSAGQISQRIEEAGATLSFENRDESVAFSSRCYYGVLDEVLEIIGECLIRPSFPEKEIALSKNEILSEIKANEDDTRSVAYKRLAELVFGKNAPYGRDPLGKPEELENLTRGDLVRFHEENYSPERMIIAMTGGYDFDQVRAKLEKIFSSWKNMRGSSFSYHEMKNETAQKTAVAKMSHKTQVDLALGTRGIRRSSNDYYSLNLGNLVLGRLGLYGRLGKNVREDRGLAYYVFSTIQAKLFSGLFGVFAGVNPSNVSKAIEGIFEELQKIVSEPIPQKELETAKRNSLGSLSISLDTSVERVGILHEIEYQNLGMDYLERYPSILERVSSEEILAAFQKYLKLEDLVIVAAGPVDEKTLVTPTVKATG